MFTLLDSHWAKTMFCVVVLFHGCHSARRSQLDGCWRCWVPTLVNTCQHLDHYFVAERERESSAQGPSFRPVSKGFVDNVFVVLDHGCRSATGSQLDGC